MIKGTRSLRLSRLRWRGEHEIVLRHAVAAAIGYINDRRTRSKIRGSLGFGRIANNLQEAISVRNHRLMKTGVGRIQIPLSKFPCPNSPVQTSPPKSPRPSLPVQVSRSVRRERLRMSCLNERQHVRQGVNARPGSWPPPRLGRKESRRQVIQQRITGKPDPVTPLGSSNVRVFSVRPFQFARELP